MIDCSTIGSLAAQLMDEVSSAYDDDVVRTVAIVVEVDRDDSTALVIRSTEDRRWALQAYLETAAGWLDDLSRRTLDEGPEECDE